MLELEVDCEPSGVGGQLGQAGQPGGQTSFLLSPLAGENSKCVGVPVLPVVTSVTNNNNDKHRLPSQAGINLSNPSAVSTQQNNLNTSYNHQHHLHHLQQHQQQQYHHHQQQPRHNNHQNGKHWNTMVRARPQLN